jgi:cyclophilin family peptidyl-prolyl cis-trans isomerase
VQGVLIQGGDPKGDGTGGPGYAIKAEFSERSHTVGAVGMARSQDPDSAGSQFYICLKPLPQLDRQYTVFGQVIEGMDVAAAIQKGERMNEVKIERVPGPGDKLPPDSLK